MVYLISEGDPATAYVKAVDCILEYGGKECEVYNLVVEIEEPLHPNEQIDNYFRELILDSKGRKGEKYIKWAEEWTLSSDNPRSYWQKLRNWHGYDQLENGKTGIIKRIRYFPGRRLAALIYNPQEDINTDKDNTGIILDPMKDFTDFPFRTPCMVLVNILYRDNMVNLFALFRGHDFGRKAYGNYLALGKLIQYICSKAGGTPMFNPGKLIVFSSSAFVQNEQKDCMKKLRDKFLPKEHCKSEEAA